MRRRILLATAAAGPALAQGGAQGDWPSRPLRFVVPGPAGGAGDVTMRIVAERMAPLLGQTIAVENRPGAGTNIGMTAVARSAPDGYTVGLASIASHAVNRWLYKALPFDPVRDFSAVGLIALVPNLMVVAPSLPVTDVAGFIAFAKARGDVNYGSVGAGSSQHLAGAQFGLATGIAMQHVPYTSSGPLNTDLMEGRVQVLFQSISAVAELARAGRMRPLAVTGTERLPAFPEVPTLREAGVDIVSTGWFGLCTPAGVPEPVLARLEAALRQVLAEPEVVARLVGLGAVPRFLGRADFSSFMAAESARWRPVVAATGASVE